jgi:hypothetical protein
MFKSLILNFNLFGKCYVGVDKKDKLKVKVFGPRLEDISFSYLTRETSGETSSS